MYQEINGEIDLLTPQLDETNDDLMRDVIQMRIQQLDALAADKLQEADRLEAEADVLSSTLAAKATVEVTPEIDQNISGIDLSQDISPDDLKFSIDETPDYHLMEYKSLNANIQYSQLQASIDSANSYRGRAKEILEQYNSETDPKKRVALYDEFTGISQRITVLDQKTNEEIAISNKSEIDFYKNAGDQLALRLESSEIDDEAIEALRIHQAELEVVQQKIESNRTLVENLDPTETANRSALLSEERSLIGELAATYSAISEIERELESASSPEEFTAEAIDDVDITDESIEFPSGVTDETDVDENLRTDVAAEQSPENLEIETQSNVPLPGKLYVTPMSQKYVSSLSQQELNEISARNPELKMDFNLSESSDDGQWTALITEMTVVDAQGLDILRESPQKLRYMSAVLAADTLRSLENAKAIYAQRISTSADDQLREADRLKEMVKYQSSSADKEFIAEKAARLIADAEVSYQKSAIAAFQAEEIRTARIAQEQLIASSMKQLKPVDLAELNALVDLPVYNVVQTDLTSDEPSATASNLKTGRRPEEAKAPATSDRIPDGLIENDSPEAVALSKPTNDANWLAMVEIVAEKRDFSDVTETMFVSVDAPVYNATNPIPIDPEMPSGLIFQVQVGAFRNPIPAEHFGEFAPVMGQKIGNGITRYRAGIFRKYKEAIVARNGIRSKGYSDAFVVAYLNGEKLTGDQAEQILAQARLAENFSVGDEMALNAQKDAANTTKTYPSQQEQPNTSIPVQPKQSDYYNDPEAAEAVQVEVVSGLFYTVQVGVYSKPVKLSGLYNLTNLNSELTAGGMIRYTTGRFASSADAAFWKQEAINAGVNDAFITAYNNGVRISLQDAQALLDENGAGALSQEVRKSKSVEQTETKAYVVVIGQFDSNVPQAVANIILERTDLNIRRMPLDGNTSAYISQTFGSIGDAEGHLKKCIEAGISQASVQELRNGTLTPLVGN
jgi:hypothetical protein